MDPQTTEALFSAFIVVAVMLLVGFPVHEGLHAWTAYRLGDNTARWMGRVSLDPRVHFDQMGGLILGLTAILSAFGAGGLLFGWAKPTPVNPMNLRHGRQGHALVAFAGPASNLAVAVLVALPIRILRSNPEWWNAAVDNPLGLLLLKAGLLLLQLNVLLFIFNLVPIPPLDGWSVIKGIVPRSMARSMQDLEIQYANVIPMVFMGFVVILFISGGAFLGPLINGISNALLGF